MDNTSAVPTPPHQHLNKPQTPAWLAVFKCGSMSDEWNKYCGVWSVYYQVIVLWLILSACDGSEQLHFAASSPTTAPAQPHLCQNIPQFWKVNLIYLFLFPNNNILLTLVTSADYIIRSLWVTRGNVCKQCCVFLSQPGWTVMKYWLFLISIHFPLIIQYWSDQSTDYASLNTTESWDPEDCSWLCGELFKLSVIVQYWIPHM